MNILSMDNQVPTWAQLPIVDYVLSDPYSHTFEFICEYSISLKENETGYRIQATSIAEVTKRSTGLLLSPLLWLSNLSLQPLPLASSGAFPHTRVRQSMDLTHEWVCLHAGGSWKHKVPTLQPHWGRALLNHGEGNSLLGAEPAGVHSVLYLFRKRAYVSAVSYRQFW